MESRLYTKQEVAEIHRCTTSCIDQWINEGLLPKGVRGKRALYTQEQIDKLDKALGIYQGDDPMSHGEKNRLLKRIAALQKENADLRAVINRMVDPALAYLSATAKAVAESRERA